MTPERWKQVEELYNAAFAKPRDEQAAFLAEACPDDEELRREVESLLQQPVSKGGILSGPPDAFLRADPPTPAGAMIGQSIGAYALQALLGAGGMGEVYRSRDARLQRDVAIKILPAAFASDPDRLARFEREARTLAALHHPNICAIFGLEEDAGIRFLVLELIEGQTLRETLAREGGRALPSRTALGIAKQVADALDVAHEKGIIHRDLKPTNVMITPEGVAKVLDFGLAKSLPGDSAAPGLTNTAAPEEGRRAGPVMGTAAYMSPEQARGQPVDKRTDIWAFGCVLYEMLSGRVAFGGDTASDTIAKILEREPDWTALPKNTPAPVRRLLRRCLAKDSKQRLRDIGDVRIEIDAALDHARATSEITARPEGARRKWLPWIALVALAATAGIWWGRREPAPMESRRDEPAAMEDPLAGAKFIRITNWPGDEGDAVISHNGNFAVFLAAVAGKFDVWLTQLGTGSDDFKNLTEDLPSVGSPGPFLRNIGISTDGSQIWISPAEERRLHASDVPTEPKWLLKLVNLTKRRSILGTDTEALAWSPDGNRVVYFKTDTGSDVLYVADSAEAEPKQILANQKPGMHNHNPVWAPDNERIYFTHGGEPTGKMAIMRISRSGGEPEKLIEANGAHFLAVLNERTLLFIARADDRSGPWLWALDIASRQVRRLNPGMNPITSVSASGDGRRVLLTVSNPSAALWRVPLVPGRTATEADVQPYPIKSESGRSLAPRFGKASLFFLSSRGGDDGLWQMQGREAREIPKDANVVLTEPAAVSPKDERVALVAYNKQDGKRRLMILSAGGSEPPHAVTSIDIKGAANQGAVDWSPDGKYIVAGGVREDGVTGLFRIPVNGGKPDLLVEGTATNPVWSPSDDLIVYAGRFERGQVTLFGVRPSDRTPVEIRHLVEEKDVPVRVRPGGYRFHPDGKLVFVPTTSSPDFWLLDLATRKSTAIATLSDSHGRQITFDISRDGRSIVFDRMPENSDIWLIEVPKTASAQDSGRRSSR